MPVIRATMSATRRVQYRLLKHGIESAPMTTDSGIDLVAYAPYSKRAVTIQVKANEKPKPAGRPSRRAGARRPRPRALRARGHRRGAGDNRGKPPALGGGAGRARLADGPRHRLDPREARRIPQDPGRRRRAGAASLDAQGRTRVSRSGSAPRREACNTTRASNQRFSPGNDAWHNIRVTSISHSDRLNRAAAPASITHKAGRSAGRTVWAGSTTGCRGPCSTRCRMPALSAPDTRKATRRAALIAGGVSVRHHMPTYST